MPIKIAQVVLFEPISSVNVLCGVSVRMKVLAWGARGIPHAFANRAKDLLRIMIMWIPGGAEGLFQEMRAYLQAVGGAPDPQVVAELQSRYGCTHVGPQIPVPGL